MQTSVVSLLYFDILFFSVYPQFISIVRIFNVISTKLSITFLILFHQYASILFWSCNVPSASDVENSFQKLQSFSYFRIM